MQEKSKKNRRAPPAARRDPVLRHGRDGILFFLSELNDTINTDGFAGLRVDEDIRGVHIFEVKPVADIVDSVTVTIVMETFCSYHLIYLRFSGESLTINKGLR